MSAQSQYKIIEATITADRLGSNEIDVRPAIVELVLFEDIEKPYVTGQVIISDDNGTFDAIQFSGTERLTIHLASVESTAPVTIPRTFIMTSIENSVKSSDAGSSSVLMFTLIDEHAFLSKAKKISRTVQGSLETEIAKICANDLNKDVDLSYSYEVPSIQNNFKAIIPYMHPLQAVEWMRARATTITGSPFFVYASIHDERIRVGNLDVMLKQTAFNSDYPYTYSPSNVQRQEENSFVQRAFHIQTMRTAKLQNTMQQMMSGGIGASYNNTNLNSGRISSSHFSVSKTLENLQNANTIPSNKTQNVYDADQRIDDKALDEFDSKVIHSITSTGTYGNFKSIHDEDNIEKMKYKVSNIAIRQMLFKNMYELTVPGTGFLISQASVGDIVNLKVLSDEVSTDKKENVYDTVKSGDFLIYNVRHTFKDTRHDTVMTVCKLTRS